MPDRSVIECPPGFEPVIDTVCDGVAVFVEANVSDYATLAEVAKIWPDGRDVGPLDQAECGACGRTDVNLRDRGFSRDSEGVRRLW